MLTGREKSNPLGQRGTVPYKTDVGRRCRNDNDRGWVYTYFMALQLHIRIKYTPIIELLSGHKRKSGLL